MAKALKAAAIVTGGAALAIVTGGAALGLGVALSTSAFGVSAGALLLASTALSTGSALLTKKPSVTAAQTDRLFANIDPRAFRKTPLGSTALPVDVRYEEWSGGNQEYCDWIVAHASCAIDGIDEIWFDTEKAWTPATGAIGKFAGYFTVPNIVLEGTPANAFSFASGKWNGSARLTGCAYSRWRFKTTGNGKKAESPFASGIPSRITVVGRGAKLYDPRRDSTAPGGSGPMRADDQSTWRFTADDGTVIGENLPLQILRVVLGWRIRNPVTGEMRLATGSGVPARRLRLASWIVAANLADERVNRSAGGTEPRYAGAAVVSEGDDPRTTLDMLSAGCCGRFRDTSGKLSFDIAHNDLAAVATDEGLLDDDVVGGFTWDPDPGLEAAPNVVRGRYVDASANSLYQLIDYPEVRIVSPDGTERIFTLDLGAVESPSQAQRVVKQGLQRKQYQRRFTAPFDIRAWKYQVGQVVPFTFAPLGFGRTVFRVEAQELGQGGVCNMTLSFEHPAIYAFDADDRAPVQAAAPIVYDSRNNPIILAIDEAATTAVWENVADPTGKKPEDNATRGAPAGTKVGDIDAGVLIADFDQAKLNIAAEMTVAGTWRGQTDQLIHQPDGTASRTVIEQLGAESERHRVFITDLSSVDPVTGIGKRLMAVTSDNTIVGMEAVAGGGLADLRFLGRRFVFVDEGGGNPTRVLDYQNGEWVFESNISARRITYESLVPKFAGQYQDLNPDFGFQELPGGFMIQWGRYRQPISREVSFSILFPRPFPTAVAAVTATPFIATASISRDLWIQNLGTPSTSGASFFTQAADANAQALDGFDWIAFGR